MKVNYSVFLLALLMIGIFILQQMFHQVTESLLLTQNAFHEPWRFITAIFIHGSYQHILFNLFGLILFGFILEQIIGTKKFLWVFFTTGILANLISIFFYTRSLGASGAIFGVIGTLTILRPLLTVWAFSLPMPLFLASVLWVVGDIIGFFVPSDIANLAHLSGIGIGLLFGIMFLLAQPRKNPYREKIILSEEGMKDWEERYVKPR